MATTKTTITTRAMRPSVRRTTASSQTTTTSGTWTRTAACSSRCAAGTPMTTLTPTIAWCTSCVERALFHTVMTPHTSFGSSSESNHNHLHTIHGAFSLTCLLFASFSFPSCPSPSTSSTTSCSLSSTTRSSWQVCATPPQKRVRAPHRFFEPNLLTFGELNDSSVPFSFMIPSWDVDDVTVGKLLTEAHRVNFVVTRFSEDIQTVRMVDRSGQPDERNSSNAQIRTLLEEQRQTIVAEYREKVSHHELHAAHAEEERPLLQGQLWRQKLEFREAHQQRLTQMEELRKFQSSTFDTIARRKLIEDQNTIFELSGRVQELQNEVNCMSDSKDFQDAESVRSGNSHVTSRPVSFPPHPIPGGMLRQSFVSPSRREGPPCIWDTHGLSGNVFGRSTCIFISSLSSRIASIEFVN